MADGSSDVEYPAELVALSSMAWIISSETPLALSDFSPLTEVSNAVSRADRTLAAISDSLRPAATSAITSVFFIGGSSPAATAKEQMRKAEIKRLRRLFFR